MLSFQRQRDARIMKRHGGGLTYVLRRKNSVKEPLKLASAASGGAASISLTGSARLLRKGDGAVKKNSTFTLAGVAGTYTVASDATVTANPLTLTFTPVLAGDAALNALLTWVQPYAEHTYNAMNGASQIQKDVRMREAGELVRWLQYDSTKPAPEAGDDLGGLAIKEVEPIGSAGVSRYKVIVGAAS